jgi:hypothetical protein
MQPKINILTRTSNRPNSFKRCHNSIKYQTYENINHIVSCDNAADLEYLKSYDDIAIIEVDRDTLIKNDPSPAGIEGPSFWSSPHNLYCNSLLDSVHKGWIIFLDDDDELINEHAISTIVSHLEDEDTMLFWQMQYTNGSKLPDQQSFDTKTPRIFKIGSPCFMIHEKWKGTARWDSFKCADARYIEKIFAKIPNSKWIQRPFITINGQGLGHKGDMK